MTRGRILIVDADAAIRENLQKMLQIDGYEAPEAAIRELRNALERGPGRRRRRPACARR